MILFLHGFPYTSTLWHAGIMPVRPPSGISTLDDTFWNATFSFSGPEASLLPIRGRPPDRVVFLGYYAFFIAKVFLLNQPSYSHDDSLRRAASLPTVRMSSSSANLRDQYKSENPNLHFLNKDCLSIYSPSSLSSPDFQILTFPDFYPPGVFLDPLPLFRGPSISPRICVLFSFPVNLSSFI